MAGCSTVCSHSHHNRTAAQLNKHWAYANLSRDGQANAEHFISNMAEMLVNFVVRRLRAAAAPIAIVYTCCSSVGDLVRAFIALIFTYAQLPRRELAAHYSYCDHCCGRCSCCGSGWQRSTTGSLSLQSCRSWL